MSQLAVGYKSAVNGREQRSDGLRRHLGLTDTSSLRINGSGGYPPLTGAGIEQLYAAPTGFIQSFDRDANQYRDLSIQARSIAIFPQGGSLQLPANAIDGAALKTGSVTTTEIKDGTIQTADIAANAVQQLLGQHFATPTFSTSAGGYVETPVQVTVTPTAAGSTLRIEGQVTLLAATAGTYCLLGLGVDGVANNTPAALYFPASNQPTQAHFVWYTPNPGGTHRYAVFVASGGGAISMHTSVQQALYVTEQKR